MNFLTGCRCRFTARKQGGTDITDNNSSEEDVTMEFVTLNNELKCPVVGIGTFMLAPADAQNSVREALKMGYRLIDTANAYVNERAVGRGIKESGVPREEIFLSTKLWPSEYENENAVDETLERLGVSSVELLYIHQPAGNWLAGYRQLEKAYKEGKAKAIGISNFEGKYIAELEKEWEIAPQFIQVEAHPYFAQDELRQTLDKYGIKLMSWYPLGHGDRSLIEEPIFKKLGEKYGKSSAQVILRWHTQMGFVVIPGSKNVAHIKDNLDIMDFTLTDDEMAEIAKLNKGVRYYTRTDEALAGFASWQPQYEKA
jgi:diketogulonate reductase-like aldo/keto reductase